MSSIQGDCEVAVAPIKWARRKVAPMTALGMERWRPLLIILMLLLVAKPFLWLSGQLAAKSRHRCVAWAPQCAQ